MNIATACGTKPQLCSCGQDLEGRARQHCPRCGCQLGRTA